MSVKVTQTITVTIEHEFTPDLELDLTEAQARALRDQLDEVLRDKSKLSFPPGVRDIGIPKSPANPFIWPTPYTLYGGEASVTTSNPNVDPVNPPRRK